MWFRCVSTCLTTSTVTPKKQHSTVPPKGRIYIYIILYNYIYIYVHYIYISHYIPIISIYPLKSHWITILLVKWLMNISIIVTNCSPRSGFRGDPPGDSAAGSRAAGVAPFSLRQVWWMVLAWGNHSPKRCYNIYYIYNNWSYIL